MFLVSLNLDLDKFEDVLNIVEVASLADQSFLYLLDSLTVLIIEEFEGVDEVHVLEGNQTLLEDAEIEHFRLLNSRLCHLVRECFEH